MAQSMYTPFMAKAGATLGKGMMGRAQMQKTEQENELYQQAYMGDQESLQLLMQSNPEMAMKIEQKKLQDEQLDVQRSATARTVNREDQEVLQSVLGEAAKLGTFQEAQDYTARTLQAYGIQAPPLTEEAYSQAVQQAQSTLSQDKAMNTKEWEHFSKLDTEEQKLYLKMKRAGKTFKSGDVEMSVDEIDDTASPIVEAGSDITTQAEQQQLLTEQEAIKVGTIEGAKDTAEMAAKYYARLEPLSENIRQLDRGVELLDSGAGTGVIEDLFPSFKAASIELDNLQSKLGLNVIANTTFGALSAGELALALRTAMPTGLDEPALRDFMVKRKAAQIKLRNYIESAVDYLGTPGNTLKSWNKMQRDQRKRVEKGKPTKAYNMETGKMEVITDG